MKHWILIQEFKNRLYGPVINYNIINIYDNKYDAYRTALNMVKDSFLHNSPSNQDHNPFYNKEKEDIFNDVFTIALNKGYRKALNVYNQKLQNLYQIIMVLYFIQ